MMPIIEEIQYEKEVQDIQVVGSLTHAGNLKSKEGGIMKKINKERKRQTTEEENLEAVKVASVQDKVDWKATVCDWQQEPGVPDLWILLI